MIPEKMLKLIILQNLIEDNYYEKNDIFLSYDYLDVEKIKNDRDMLLSEFIEPYVVDNTR